MAKKFTVPDRDPLTAQLEIVGNSRRGIRNFRIENSDVFDQYDVMGADLAQAEAFLKELARKTGQKEVIGGGLRLEIRYPKSVSYDSAAFQARIPDAVTRFPEVFDHQINKAAFERRVAMGDIPADVVGAVKVESAGTPAVTIKDA